MLGLDGELEEYVGKLHSGEDPRLGAMWGRASQTGETACDGGATTPSASCQHAIVAAVREEYVYVCKWMN